MTSSGLAQLAARAVAGLSSSWWCDVVSATRFVCQRTRSHQVAPASCAVRQSRVGPDQVAPWFGDGPGCTTNQVRICHGAWQELSHARAKSWENNPVILLDTTG